VGEEVLALMPETPRGFTAKWEGPFTVTDKPTPLTYRISAPGRSKGKKGRVVHRNLLKRMIADVNAVTVVTVSEEAGTGQLDIWERSAVRTHALKDRWETATNLNHLDKKQQDELKGVLDAFEPTFSDVPGLAKNFTFPIPTGQTKPVAQYPYRVPLKWRDKLEEEIETLLSLGIIRKSSSPWTSPVVCVPKKDGAIRVCVDYRRLNA